MSKRLKLNLESYIYVANVPDFVLLLPLQVAGLGAQSFGLVSDNLDAVLLSFPKDTRSS
jgi:hypothetical protein